MSCPHCGQALLIALSANGARPPGVLVQGLHPRLSARENAILLEIAAGASNKAIARKLAITDATVKVHVKSILRKLRVRNRTQAAVQWQTTGLEPIIVNGVEEGPENFRR